MSEISGLLSWQEAEDSPESLLWTVTRYLGGLSMGVDQWGLESVWRERTLADTEAARRNGVEGFVDFMAKDDPDSGVESECRFDVYPADPTDAQIRRVLAETGARLPAEGDS